MNRPIFTPLDCTGRDGKMRTFYYTYDPPAFGREEHCFKVWEQPAREACFFELRLKELRPGALRIVYIGHYNELAFAQRGIPEILLPEAARRLAATIFSSPTSGEAGDVFRSPPATRMWERLVRKGLATYDASADVFETI